MNFQCMRVCDLLDLVPNNQDYRDLVSVIKQALLESNDVLRNKAIDILNDGILTRAYVKNNYIYIEIHNTEEYTFRVCEVPEFYNNRPSKPREFTLYHLLN